MEFKKSMFAIAVGVCLFSCSNEDGLDRQIVEDERVSSFSRNSEALFTTFVYHGKTYESCYQVDNDSSVVYKNPEVQALAEYFDTTPELVTFIYPNGMMEYFDTHDEFMKSLERVKEEVNVISGQANAVDSHFYAFPSKGPADNVNNDAELYLYDDTGFSSRRGDIILKKGAKKVEIPHLKKNFSPNMNDKTSSLEAYSIAGTTLFELFEDNNYRSHCMSFILNNSIRWDFVDKPFSLPFNDTPKPDNPRSHWGKGFDANLKDNYVVGTHNSSWNDRITSVRITRQ